MACSANVEFRAAGWFLFRELSQKMDLFLFLSFYLSHKGIDGSVRSLLFALFRHDSDDRTKCSNDFWIACMHAMLLARRKRIHSSFLSFWRAQVPRIFLKSEFVQKYKKLVRLKLQGQIGGHLGFCNRSLFTEKFLFFCFKLIQAMAFYNDGM